MSPDPRIARTRERVLAAAWELINEVGFEAITVEQVSERSGVARSTLYRHWRTVPEILRDAFAELGAQQRPSSPPDLDAPPPPDAGRQALVDYARAVATGLTDVWGRAAASLAGSALLDPEQRTVLRVFVDGTRRDLRAILERGATTGELDDVIDLDAAVDRLVDLVIAPQFYRYMFTDQPYDADQAAALADTAWADVRRRP